MTLCFMQVLLCQVLAMILGLAAAQDPNYHARNYHDNDRPNPPADERKPQSTTPVPILHWNKQQEHDGTYKTRYRTLFCSVSPE